MRWVLISTAYQRIGQLHEMAGGNAEAIHPQMMADALIGCDVLPAAAHLTASMLSGAHPTIKYQKSSILTVAYGRQADGGIALGSLDLLIEQGELDIIAVAAKAVEGMGETDKSTWSSLPHAAFDAVIMNPPFTRATGHEGEKIGIHNPMFAAFSASPKDQKLMGNRIKELTKGTSAHGNAGEGSFFLVLADRKLKTNGRLALVLPLSMMSGDAWEKSRELLAKNYSRLILVSIAGYEDDEMSFSADTGMGECLVVGQKSKQTNSRATFVVLKERPAYPMLGSTAAREVHQLVAAKKLRRIEDGPVGGTPLHFGDEIVGQVMDAPLPSSGIWNLARIADLSLAQAAYQLANESRVWLPQMKKTDAAKIPISTVLGIKAKIGPYHSDISGFNTDKTVRGPFDVSPLPASGVPTYPMLWAHETESQKTIRFEADSEGVPRQGGTTEEQDSIDKKVTSVWATASHCHFNQNFRFNSQATGMQYTSQKTLGGRAWISIGLKNVAQEKALTLWGNSSLGLLLHWWHANKQQAGRGNIGVSALESLPVLNVTKLTKKQLSKTVKLFDKVCVLDLLPIHEIDNDSVRSMIDEEFARDVLGLKASLTSVGGPLELLRRKLAQEPSIRGAK